MFQHASQSKHRKVLPFRSVSRTSTCVASFTPHKEVYRPLCMTALVSRTPDLAFFYFCPNSLCHLLLCGTNLVIPKGDE